MSVGARWPVVPLVCLALCVVAVPSAASETPRLVNPPGRGVPAGGPSLLYAPVPDIPEIQNHDPRFVAPYEMVSGTERYVDGEYLYTDFVYEDENFTYPEDPDLEVWANNSADLFEFRMSTRGDDLLVRFSFTTLLVEDTTIATVAFDVDQDATTGSDTLPRDPGLPFPGTDQVLTTWGSGAEWSRWNGTDWDTLPLKVTTDLDANQITVTVPPSVASPGGQWLGTLATGVHDTETGDWWAPGGTDLGGTALPADGLRIVNLGFRFDEVDPAPPREEAGNSAPMTRQDQALAAGEPTRYANLIDFDLLHSRGARDNVPTLGMMYRLFASRMDEVMTSTDGTPENGDLRFFGEGVHRGSLHGRYLSRIQPYAIYVPSGYQHGIPTPMTFAMHGDSGRYHWLNDNSNASSDLFGEQRGSIVLSPAGRGFSGFYVGHHEADLFEAWNDVARHFTLDSQRTSLTGYSMGGHGSYRLALLWPHLFARSVPIVPAMCRGLWYIASCSAGEETVLARWIENARNVPIFHIADGLSELTFYPGQAQLVMGPAVNDYQSLESLGYRYRFWSVATDHFLVGTDHPEVTEFLGQHQIEPEPFHVTFSRMPSTDLEEVGLVHDTAYWLSGIKLRVEGDALAKGVIDAVSLGFGKSDPPSSLDAIPGTTNFGWPYFETQRTWGEPGEVPVENRILIEATNIARVTIDPAGARVGCDVTLDVTSDGPIEVQVLGCPTVPSGADAPTSAPGEAPVLAETGAGALLPGIGLLAAAGAMTNRRRHRRGWFAISGLPAPARREVRA